MITSVFSHKVLIEVDENREIRARAIFFRKNWIEQEQI